MDAIITKLINDTSSYDSSLAQGMDGIQEVLGSVKDRISELRGLLDMADVSLSCKEFSQRLKDLKAGWEETMKDLAVALAEIENDMLGGDCSGSAVQQRLGQSFHGKLCL